jgi:hypothetical protein
MIVNFIVDLKLTVEKSIIALKLVLSEEVKSTWRPGMERTASEELLFD